MPDWLQLYLVFWALRALEHVQWRPAEAILFEGRRSGRFRMRPAPSGTEDLGASVVVTNPFRFLSLSFRSGSPAGALDVREVSRLLKRLDSVSGRVFRAQAALSIHLFIIVPIVWTTVGLARSWIYLAAGVLVLHVATILALHGALRRIGATSAGDRWQRLLPFLLSPPAATEAMLGLTKDLLRGFHPVAVAAVLCDESAFREIAIRSLRRTAFPAAPEGEQAMTVPEGEARTLELRTVIAARLGAPEFEIPEPRRTSLSARWYCPRCLAEYSSFAGSCADCGGVSLKAYEGP
jgi:hypothetical protein